MTDSVLIIAAEASSSLYAQRLLELWKSEGRNVSAFGIGSREMEKLGFECLGRSEEMAVVGLQEVIKHFPLIRKTFYALLNEAEKRKPKFALLMDYPDFNLRLAKQLKKRGIKVIYYISPQIWAWRTGRVKTVKKVVDHMFVLFPFEVPFYSSHNVKVDFVGHPALDELGDPSTAASRKIQRNRFGLGDDDIVLGLMPGSRRSEIEHHLQTQLEAAALLVKRQPRVRPVLMVAPTLERDFLRRAIDEAMARTKLPIGSSVQIIKENPLEMIDLADVMLVASGTATLMVGLMDKPMVIMYRMTAITAWIAKRLVTKTRFFGLVNLVMGREIVPELFQEKANPEALSRELENIILDRSRYNQMVIDLHQVREKLGSRGTTRRVASLLAEYFG